MDLNNMDDFMKKALESEMNVDDTLDAEQINMLGDRVKNLLNVLSGGKMIKLGRVAMDKKERIIDELIEYLSHLDKKDKASWHAHASVKIQSAAKKLGVLEVIVVASTLGCTATEEQFGDVIESVIRLNCL